MICIGVLDVERRGRKQPRKWDTKKLAVGCIDNVRPHHYNRNYENNKGMS